VLGPPGEVAQGLSAWMLVHEMPEAPVAAGALKRPRRTI
jgi:hypothetical protein